MSGMEFWGWLAQKLRSNFSAPLASWAVLLIATMSFHSETKTRRIANLLAITSNHRELWKEYLNDPKSVARPRRRLWPEHGKAAGHRCGADFRHDGHPAFEHGILCDE